MKTNTQATSDTLDDKTTVKFLLFALPFAMLIFGFAIGLLVANNEFASTRDMYLSIAKLVVPVLAIFSFAAYHYCKKVDHF